jgi:hypothetical protein
MVCSRDECGLPPFSFYGGFAVCILVPVRRGMRIILETVRLTLRQFTEDDVDNRFRLNSDPR